MESNFTSHGERCAGTLYLPDSASHAPVVVMGHGLGGLKEFRIPAYAERFVAGGLAVFAFDYRHWGDSGGEPRQLLLPQRQLQDWHAALAHVRTLEGVDGQRIGIWGSSFGGAHVIHVATQDRDIRAVVAQVPAADAAHSPGISTRLTLKMGTQAILDAIGSRLGRPPRYLQLIGQPGENALLSTEECWEGYMGLVPEGVRWDNHIVARSLLKLPSHRAVKVAGQVSAPVLLQAGIRDSLVAVEDVRKLAGLLPEATLKEYDCNHFQPYYPPLFDKFSSTQTAFFAEHLLGK